MKGSEKERREGRGIGERFHEETKYTAERIGYALDWHRMPEPYKNYTSPIATIALPEPLIGQAAHVWDVFDRRRSTRAFSPARNLPLGLLSSLLWSTQGITAKEGEWYFRAAPSAGGLCPIQALAAHVMTPKPAAQANRSRSALEYSFPRLRETFMTCRSPRSRAVMRRGGLAVSGARFPRIPADQMKKKRLGLRRKLRSTRRR